ncbi:AMP-binding protein [Lutibacter holmesii]|uniref:AMP-binding protein n=1 Tax=Lutibacter holmesii TaxID=1137985 RepID=A0ABW3WRS3_9FLAO
MNVSKPFHSAFKLQRKSFYSVNELIVFSKSISEDIHAFLIDWFNDNLYVEVKTSGSTTGAPKLIQLQKAHMINSAKATGSFFNLNSGTKALLCMSANYIAGKMMLVRALTLGWSLDVIAPVSNPINGIDTVYDFCAMVPLQMHNSLNEMHKVKQLIVGGGVVSKELEHKIQSIPTSIFATYGMTETITHIAVKKLNNFTEATEKREIQSFYKLLPNISINLDQRGCLVINAPKLSYEKVVTNDLVEIISEDEFKWLGRFDTIINSGGIKLIPEQIELKISELLANRFFVAGIPDAILGEKLVLFVEGEKQENLLGQISQLKTISKFEIPKNVFFLQKFIETPTQKINRIKTIKLISSTC